MERPVGTLLLVAALIAILTGVARASSAGLWLDVPFVAQTKRGCGPAAVAMVMQYWRVHGAPVAAEAADLAQIERTLEPQAREDAPASALEHYLRERGFAVYAFRGSWSDLAHHLSRGRPLIVAFRPAGSRSLHYVVLAGLDEAHGVVLVNDPARRKLLKLDRSEFQKGWKDTQDWTLLVLPPPTPSRIPAR
jgi:ABC-type bacteriocin/lantibiotic exporter with double-glycine peptidase domain